MTSTLSSPITKATLRASDARRIWYSQRKSSARWAKLRNTSRNLHKKVKKHFWTITIRWLFFAALVWFVWSLPTMWTNPNVQIAWSNLGNEVNALRKAHTEGIEELFKANASKSAEAKAKSSPEPSNSISPEAAPGAEVGLNLKLSPHLSLPTSQENNP